MDLVRQRIEQLSDADLQLQRWFIRASFTTLVMGDVSEQMPSYIPEIVNDVPAADEYIQAARAIGDHIESIAVQVFGGMNVLGS